MIVKSVTLERPVGTRPMLYAMATVRTDRGVFVFAAMEDGRINHTSYRYNGQFRHAFELHHEDQAVCHDAIRHEIENERARTYGDVA